MDKKKKQYTTVSIYFNHENEEDAKLLEALKSEVGIGMSLSGLIKQITYNHLGLNKKTSKENKSILEGFEHDF